MTQAQILRIINFRIRDKQQLRKKAMENRDDRRLTIIGSQIAELVSIRTIVRLPSEEWRKRADGRVAVETDLDKEADTHSGKELAKLSGFLHAEFLADVGSSPTLAPVADIAIGLLRELKGRRVSNE